MLIGDDDENMFQRDLLAGRKFALVGQRLPRIVSTTKPLKTRILLIHVCFVNLYINLHLFMLWGGREIKFVKEMYLDVMPKYTKLH